MRRHLWIGILCLVGCSLRVGPASHDSDHEAFAGAAYAEAERVQAKRALAAPPPVPMPAPMASADSQMFLQTTASPSPDELSGGGSLLPEAPAARKVHYDGFLALRATQVDGTLQAITEVAEEAGGRVERLTGREISIRVPAAEFGTTWERLRALGDVLDHAVRADDVTEQFTAVELRVQTLTATRDRLVALLARATDENEKLMLLREITRVTEQLDQVEGQLRTLSDLADFARITVRVHPRQAFTGTVGPELSGFEWIRGLSPFRRAVHDSTRRIALDTPEGFVSLGKRGPYIAESADGAVLWTMRIDNDPVGGGDFWVGAIEDRIGEEFGGLRRAEVGAWSCVILEEPGAAEPYQWRICLRPEGRHLSVAQAYFPGPEQVERYGEPIDVALVGGGA